MLPAQLANDSLVSQAIGVAERSPIRSQRELRSAIYNHASGLQNGCSGPGASHVTPGMQEEEAEKIDERLRKALASGRGDAQHREFLLTIGKKHPWPMTPRAEEETSDCGVRVEI